jgi:hypothetical protein
VFAHLKKSQLARFETRTLVSGLSSINVLIVPVVLLIVLHLLGGEAGGRIDSISLRRRSKQGSQTFR